MRFLVDAQLPPALARMLSAHGHQAEHVADLAMLTASDLEIWSHAKASESVLLTKDEDFVRLQRNTDGPTVIWIRLGNTTRRALLEWFEPVVPRLEEMLAEGEPLIELR